MVDALSYINRGINKISTSAYNQMSKNSPWFWGKLYFSANKSPLANILYSSNSLMSNKLVKLIKDFKPDAIICTHPFAIQMCTYLKEHGKIDSKLYVVMTDYEIHMQWYSNHKYINKIYVGSTVMKDDLIIKEVDADKVEVTGIPIKKEFRENFDKNAIYDSLGFDKNKKTFLFFGGGEYGLNRELVYNTLTRALEIFPAEQFIVISGKNEKLFKEFKNIINKSKIDKKQIKLYQYSKKVPEFMAISAAVFSKPGGLTTSEAIASGLPFIIIGPLPGQEYANTIFLLDNNAGLLISGDNRIDYILNNLKKHPESFKEMSKNAKQIAKPNATIDIIENIIKDI